MKYLAIFALIATTLMLNSCKKNDFDGAQIMIHMMSKVGTADLQYDTEYQNSDGIRFELTRAQMYLSNLEFYGPDGNTTFEDLYILANPGATHVDVGCLSSGHYHGVRFNVGLDATANHSDPNTYAIDHPLSIQNPNYSNWGWTMGYQFITIEGKLDTTAAQNGQINVPFELHLGTDALLQTADITKHFDSNDDETVTLHLKIDYLELFEGIDFRNNNTTHTGDNLSLATQVMQNSVNCFSFN